MAVTTNRGLNKPRIAGVWCEWTQDDKGNWTLRRLDTHEVVGAVDNVWKRKNFTARIGDEILATKEQYLSPAKHAVEQTLDAWWQAT